MNAEECGRRGRKTQKRPPRQKQNPIEAAVRSWYEKHAAHFKNEHNVEDLVIRAPKRWSAYGPLILLPAGSFTSEAWSDVLSVTLDSHISCLEGGSEEANEGGEGPGGPRLLWKTILDEIARSTNATLTHLAINEGIPLQSKKTNSGGNGGAAGESENILRSPSGLRMLYGDFGPSAPSAPSAAGSITDADFSRAFWTSTKQNGITQMWAPRWTMFSRGNIKEKARLLDFHSSSTATTTTTTTIKSPDTPRDGDVPDALAHRRIPRDGRTGCLAVDLYAGIGYFAFCYAALGFRVLCWELNPWSVEGLRRGAEANGWSVRVIRPPSSGEDEGDGEEDRMLGDVLAGAETIVVFLEDNVRAARRIARLDELARDRVGPGLGIGIGGGEGEMKPAHDAGLLRKSRVMHVNCGLLPSSEGSWATAWDVARDASRAWLHVHENVGTSDIEAKKDEIRQWFADRDLAADDGGGEGVRADVRIEHVELVKTFAPGVWHCVFDVYIKRDRDGIDTSSIT